MCFRSCHKMVLDAKYRHIFILGRYLEKGLRDESRNVKVEDKHLQNDLHFLLY